MGKLDENLFISLDSFVTEVSASSYDNGKILHKVLNHELEKFKKVADTIYQVKAEKISDEEYNSDKFTPTEKIMNDEAFDMLKKVNCIIKTITQEHPHFDLVVAERDLDSYIAQLYSGNKSEISHESIRNLNHMWNVQRTENQRLKEEHKDLTKVLYELQQECIFKENILNLDEIENRSKIEELKVERVRLQNWLDELESTLSCLIGMQHRRKSRSPLFQKSKLLQITDKTQHIQKSYTS